MSGDIIAGKAKKPRTLEEALSLFGNQPKVTVEIVEEQPSTLEPEIELDPDLSFLLADPEPPKPRPTLPILDPKPAGLKPLSKPEPQSSPESAPVGSVEVETPKPRPKLIRSFADVPGLFDLKPAPVSAPSPIIPTVSPIEPEPAPDLEPLIDGGNLQKRYNTLLPNRNYFLVYSHKMGTGLNWRHAVIWSFLVYRTNVNHGCSAVEISKATGIARDTVRKILKELSERKMAHSTEEGWFSDVPDNLTELFHMKKEAETEADESSKPLAGVAYWRYYNCEGMTNVSTALYSKLISQGSSIYYKQLSSWLGVDERWVGKSLRKMEQQGLIRVVKNEKGHGKTTFELMRLGDKLEWFPKSKAKAKKPAEKGGTEPPTIARIDGFSDWFDETGYDAEWANKLEHYFMLAGVDKMRKKFNFADGEHDANKGQDPEKRKGTSVALLLKLLEKDFGPLPDYLD